MPFLTIFNKNRQLPMQSVTALKMVKMTVDAAALSADTKYPFERFAADPYCAKRWPLTALIAREVVDSPQLGAMVVSAPVDKRLVTDFTSAVHLQVLRHAREPFARYCYAVSGEATQPVDDQTASAFRDFVSRHRSDITRTMQSVWVQTNEPARCLALYPGIQIVADRTGSQAVNLVEVGSGPGLLMIPDRYCYDHAGAKTGDKASPVELHANLTGHLSPYVPGSNPRVLSVGIDPYAKYLDEPGQTDWSTACIFPEDAVRIDRLRAAAPLVSGSNRPTIVKGDANEVISRAVHEAVGKGPLIVMASFMQTYYDRGQRAEFAANLREIAASRAVNGHHGEVWRLDHDWFPNLPPEAQSAVSSRLAGNAVLSSNHYAPVVLSRIRPEGVVESTALAAAEPYGDALLWLDEEHGRDITSDLNLGTDNGHTSSMTTTR
jgi:hypothetical protein